MENKSDSQNDRPRKGLQREDDQDSEESKKTKSDPAADSARTGRPIIGEGRKDE